jgi:sugar lactone lactonase YvrE
MNTNTVDTNAIVTSEPRIAWPARAQLGEGLCWSAQQQAIWWVDILGQRLMRLQWPDGACRTWNFDETISAVAERAHEPGLVVSLRRRIALFDPEAGELVTSSEVEPQHPGNRFNDGKCDAQGRMWACTMDFGCTAPTGSLYRVSRGADGWLIDCAWCAEYPVVNGPAWSADGRTLWLNDTARNAIRAFDFDPVRGEVSNPRLWLRFAEGDGLPDGMTTDAAGRVWIAHWGGSCVTCHDPHDARELARVRLPASNVTNVAFGGADLTTLFITTASIDLDEAQLAAQPHAGALFCVNTNVSGLAPARFEG